MKFYVKSIDLKLRTRRMLVDLRKKSGIRIEDAVGTVSRVEGYCYEE